MNTTAATIGLSILVAIAANSFGGSLDEAQPQGGAPAQGERPQAAMPRTYAELIALPEKELLKFDIARINLLCAKGLPGAETLDVEKCLQILDQWAKLAKQAEEKYLPQFYRNPARYDGSLAKFKAVNLALTLKEDFGCGYNMNLIQSGAMDDYTSTRFFKNPKDVFLHGFTESKTGSCSSLPVLMVAVGRRLGYPFHLVACKGHLFCRWDDGKERFNIETACPGADSKPDSYYRTWPHPFTDEEARVEKFLKPLTPLEELGVFSQIRAACLLEHKRYQAAIEADEVALRAFPDSKLIRAYIADTKRRK